MTELEKARNNRANEIDFNKLVKELHDELESHSRRMEHYVRTGGTVPNLNELLSPTISMLSSMNAFLNRIGIDFRSASQVLASIELLKNCRSAMLDDEQKDCAREIAKALAPAITTIDMSRF